MEEAIYYIHVGGQQRGPFPLSRLIAEGLTPDTIIWRPGMAEWAPASTLPEVMAALNASRPGFSNPFQQYPPYGQPVNPYGQQQYGGYPVGWTNWLPWAIAATVIAVVFCGLLNTVFGIIGIVKANSANDAMRRGDPAAVQINNSAKTWTIVSFVLSGIALILGIIILAIGGLY